MSDRTAAFSTKFRCWGSAPVACSPAIMLRICEAARSVRTGCSSRIRVYIFGSGGVAQGPRTTMVVAQATPLFARRRTVPSSWHAASWTDGAAIEERLALSRTNLAQLHFVVQPERLPVAPRAKPPFTLHLWRRAHASRCALCTGRAWRIARGTLPSACAAGRRSIVAGSTRRTAGGMGVCSDVPSGGSFSAFWRGGGRASLTRGRAGS